MLSSKDPGPELRTTNTRTPKTENPKTRNNEKLASQMFLIPLMSWVIQIHYSHNV